MMRLMEYSAPHPDNTWVLDATVICSHPDFHAYSCCHENWSSGFDPSVFDLEILSDLPFFHLLVEDKSQTLLEMGLGS
jgi:hypothetical protein